MNETEIVERLKQNVTPPPDTTLAPVAVPEPTNGQAVIAPTFELDELTQYKLHDYFGETYRDTDEEKRQQAQYIYKHVSELIDNRDYGFVLAKIRDMERIIGLNGAENRLYKLYQWLKLDNTRRSIDAEMGSIPYA
jgi:hypothetical protein